MKNRCIFISLIGFFYINLSLGLEIQRPLKNALLHGVERSENNSVEKSCKIELNESAFVEAYPGCIKVKAKITFYNPSDSSIESTYQITLGTPVNKYPDSSNSKARCDLGDFTQKDAKLLLLTRETIDLLRSRHYFFDYYPNDVTKSKIRIHYVGIFEESDQDCVVKSVSI